VEAGSSLGSWGMSCRAVKSVGHSERLASDGLCTKNLDLTRLFVQVLILHKNRYFKQT
jgi:hypothetical protein